MCIRDRPKALLIRLLSVCVCLFLLCFIIGLLYLCLDLCLKSLFCVWNYRFGDKLYLGEIELEVLYVLGFRRIKRESYKVFYKILKTAAFDRSATSPVSLDDLFYRSSG